MYIELNRTFRTLVDDQTIIASDDARLEPSSRSLNWSDIMQLRRVVILSEAGAGKTEEIRHAAQRLRAEKKAAFFLRIEHIPTLFEAAFEEGSYEEFEGWLESTQEGWLLLDSIDEARLRDPSDFEAAVRKLGHKLQTATQRVHLVLTGRTAAWRPLSDLDLCAKHLPYSDPPGSATEVPNNPRIFTVVALDDLSAEQVRQFARAMNIANVDELLEEIERVDGWSFTARPLDLQELLEFWQSHKRIGSRLELLQASIERRLREQDQNRDEHSPLTLNRAREGARLVAAACTLTLQQAIAVPDGSHNARGLRLDSVLGDWSAVERATLLQRPVFDEEIYGVVRFHHRSVREYLAAEWFAELLKQDVARKTIEGLFFREQYGLEVVPPVMRPVLSWLAVLDQRIQEQTLRIAPEVLLGDGDPSRLYLSTRQRMLNAICADLAAGVLRHPTDYTAIQRFAAEDLTEDVKRLLVTHKDNESQIFLLQMIWQGRLVGALQEALDVAFSPTATLYTRKLAYRAVHATGSESDLARLRTTFAKESDILDRDLLAELLDLAPRSIATFDWLCDCLAKVANYRQFSVDYLREAICEFATQIDVQAIPTMVGQFNRFLDELPVIERRSCDVSSRNAWLLKPAALAINKLVKERDPATFSDAALAVLHKLPTAEQYDFIYSDGSKLDFKTLVQGWPELKFALFWYMVESARRKLDKEGKHVTDWWNAMTWGSYVVFVPTDFDHALACVSSQEFIDDKLVALSLAFHLYVECKRPTALRRRLKAACKSSPLLNDRLDTLLHPPRLSPKTIRTRRANNAWKRRDKARAKKDRENFEAWRQHLTSNVDSLRDPGFGSDGISEAQYYLYERMRSSSAQSLTTRSHTNWRSLESDFGSNVARAFRDGAVAYWRRHRPKLVSEGASIPLSVSFGLTGIAIESNETHDFGGHLNDSEVELLFRYAMHEINGFPAWLPAVFERYPTVIRKLFLIEVGHELRTSTAEQDTHYVIYNINWSGEWLWKSLAPALLTLLISEEPKNLRSLEHVLNVIQGSTVKDKKIQSLAQSRALAFQELEHCAQWYAVWTGVAPEEAIPALRTHVDSLTTDEERNNFVMTFLVQLVGGSRKVSRVRQAYRTAQHLKTLYLLAHQYIRLQDDINRTGSGVYSPELRDDAQDARELLLSLLRELPGKETFVALSQIANEHPSERYRPYITQHAKARAEFDAAGTPWTEAHIREFSSKYERTPSNHRELFDLAVLRLLDLKADLEQGDSSDAPMLARTGSERDVRTYIGNWLRNLARGRYAIPQEEELADAKRPDLRFHGTGFDAPVPVELKLADNWSGPKLFERLEAQLCGDYLRDSRSGYGIFMLVYRGKQKSWQLPDRRKTVAFEELVKALQDHWVLIAPRLPNVQNVRIIGIDLTKRTGGTT
jgi:hypothetical protein